MNEKLISKLEEKLKSFFENVEINIPLSATLIREGKDICLIIVPDDYQPENKRGLGIGLEFLSSSEILPKKIKVRVYREDSQEEKEVILDHEEIFPPSYYTDVELKEGKWKLSFAGAEGNLKETERREEKLEAQSREEKVDIIYSKRYPFYLYYNSSENLHYVVCDGEAEDYLFYKVKLKVKNLDGREKEIELIIPNCSIRIQVPEVYIPIEILQSLPYTPEEINEVEKDEIVKLVEFSKEWAPFNKRGLFDEIIEEILS
jgi:hypothetical protein